MLLLSAGWNDDGQLGRYVDYEEEEKDLPAGAVDVKSNDIKKFSCGLKHSLLVLNDGTVLGWGSNHHNQIGLPEKIAYPVPTEIAFFKDKPVIDVACTPNSSIYLSELGLVYIANKFTAKGQGILKLDIRETCIKVCTGYEWPWAVGESGKIYEIQKKNKIVKHQIEGAKIVDVSSGKEFAIAVTNEGLTYGMGAIVIHSEEFLPITTLLDVKVKNIYASANHCFALTDKGRVFVWGNGEFGQLGLGENVVEAPEFTVIQSLRDVSAISTSSITTCFVTDTKKIYACGSFGSYLIQDPPEKVFAPINVTRSVYGPAHSVSCGDHHTLVFVEGLLRYRDRTLDPELLRLRDELEASLKKKAEEEMLKKKAEEENAILRSQYEEERLRLEKQYQQELEMKIKAEEETELLLGQQERADAKRRRKEAERLRKEAEEEEERKRLEAERQKKEDELKAKNQELEKEVNKLKNEEIKTRDVKIDDLNNQNNQANNKINELNRQLEEMRELAEKAKSKCCNIC